MLNKQNSVGIMIAILAGFVIAGCSSSSKPPAKTKPSLAPKTAQKQPVVSAPTQTGLGIASGSTQTTSGTISNSLQQQAIASAATQTSPGLAIASGPTSTAPLFVYHPAGRRDPFAPIITKETKRLKGGDRPPLERYNITEFKLSGIVWGGFGYNAMLEGPDKKGYFVRVGTILGPNRGVVKKITVNSMIIEEKYKTYTGETERREIVMELRKKQEATP